MKFTVSDGEKYQKIMQAEVSVEEMALAVKQASKRISGQVNIPGFRKGKVPQAVLENFVGYDAILQEAADDILPRAYTEGLIELKLEPVEQPKIDIVTMAKDQPFVFTATFTACPEITLGQYQNLKVTKYSAQVEDSAIDADIENQRQRLSRLEDIEAGTPAAKDDIVNIDFEGFLDGVPFDGGKGENYPLQLGSNTFIPGFEDQLMGVQVDQELEVNVSFPEDYQEESLAGKPVVFKVKVISIKKRILPEINDELAANLSETAENLEQLKAEVKARLQEQLDKDTEEKAKQAALDAAIANIEFDLPEVMIEDRLEQLISGMESRLQMQGLEMDKFLSFTGQTMEQFREGYRHEALNSIQREMLLDEVVKAENIIASDEDLEAEIAQIAAAYWQPAEQIKETLSKNGQIENIKAGIARQKAADFIYENADISEEIMANVQEIDEEA